MSLRFGISTIFLIRPNVRRSRKLLATCANAIQFTFHGTRSPRHCMQPPDAEPRLLDLDRTAGVLELLLDVLGLVLGDAFLDVLRRAVDEVLRFLETQAGELTNDLDHLDLLVAGALEDDGPFVLLLGRSRRRAGSCRTGHRRHHRSRRAHAELALELLHERRRVEQRHVLDVVLDLIARDFGHYSAPPSLDGVDSAAAACVSAAGASAGWASAGLERSIAPSRRTSDAPGSWIVRRSCDAGACSRPRSCASKTSLLGSFARSATPAAGIALPASTPPVIFS